jgi:hypothetical protein
MEAIVSVEKHRDGFAFICDECGESIKPPRSTEALSFVECLELAKGKGWRVIQVHSRSGEKDWEHRCDNC